MPQIFQSIAASATMHVHVIASGKHNQVDAGIASSWLQISNGNCTWQATALIPRQNSKRETGVKSVTSKSGSYVNWAVAI